MSTIPLNEPVALTCQHCGVEQEQYRDDWMACNTWLTDGVGHWVCGLLLCLDCAEDTSVDCAKIEREVKHDGQVWESPYVC